MTNYLENIPFDELKIGDSITVTRTIFQRDAELFAYISRDTNPLHLDAEFAKSTQYGAPIIHGLFITLLLTSAVATKMPGPGSIYGGQRMKFSKPVYIGDTLTATLKIIGKRSRGNVVRIACVIRNQKEEEVFTGVSTVIAPTKKIRIAAQSLPKVTISA